MVKNSLLDFITPVLKGASYHMPTYAHRTLLPTPIYMFLQKQSQFLKLNKLTSAILIIIQYCKKKMVILEVYLEKNEYV